MAATGASALAKGVRQEISESVRGRTLCAHGVFGDTEQWKT